MAVTDLRFNPSGLKSVEQIKLKALEFEIAIREHAPKGRRQSLALSKLEDCVHFAVKAAAVGDEDYDTPPAEIIEAYNLEKEENGDA